MSQNTYTTSFYLSFLKKNLSKRRKKQFAYNIIFSIISAFCELFSVVAIIPLITLFNEEKFQAKANFLNNFDFIFDLLNIQNKELFIIIIFSILSIISSLLRIFNYWYSGFIAGRIGSDLGISLYNNILRSDYKLFLKHNSSEFTTALTYNIQSTVAVIQAIIRGFTSFTIILVLTFSLLFYNFIVGLLVIVILSIIYVFIYLKTRSKLIKNGQIIYKSRNKNLTNLKDSFASIRNIIIDDASSFFINKYSVASATEYSVEALNNALQIAPKHILEAFLFSFLAFLTLIFSVFFQSINPINFFGLVAMGSIKLLPAIQQMFLSIAQIKANQASLLEIRNLTKETQSSIRLFQKSTTIHKFKKSLKFENVSFSYSKNDKCILRNVSLEIYPKECIGVSGETGSGKSTLIDLILGLLVPSNGKIVLDGKVFEENNEMIFNWNRNISHVPQSIFLCDSSIAENIAFGLKKDQIDFQRLKEAAKIAQISDYIDTLPKKYKTQIGEDGIKLSGGQKQRIAIARALYRSKDIMVLDEATSALDALTEKNILESLFNLKTKTIIIISHNENTLKNCSRVLNVKNGSVIELN